MRNGESATHRMRHGLADGFSTRRGEFTVMSRHPYIDAMVNPMVRGTAICGFLGYIALEFELPDKGDGDDDDDDERETSGSPKKWVKVVVYDASS